MNRTSLKFSERKTATTPKGRKRHSVKVCAGNGEPILITPPNQPYYNSSDLENSLKAVANAINLHYEMPFYTESDLVAFGNVMYHKEKTLSDGVTDADLQNFKESR